MEKQTASRPLFLIEDRPTRVASLPMQMRREGNISCVVFSKIMSHCWERGEHPDPASRTLSRVAEAFAGTGIEVARSEASVAPGTISYSDVFLNSVSLDRLSHSFSLLCAVESTSSRCAV